MGKGLTNPTAVAHANPKAVAAVAKMHPDHGITHPGHSEAEAHTGIASMSPEAQAHFNAAHGING